MSPARMLIYFLASVAALSVAAIYVLPLLPVDETRYASAAWDMWRLNEFLVPHLNGEAYSHKPPLLFWMFHLGWWLTGVNEYWLRIVPALLALGSLALTYRLALRLWPGDRDIARNAALILFGFAIFLLFVNQVMFDVLLVFITLIGANAIIHVQKNFWQGWLIYGFAIGLGVLTKGPVILIHLLPMALFAPSWFVDRDSISCGNLSWKRWYGATLVAFLFGAMVALTWAIPAGIAGGDAYRNAIFWGQTANRVVDSFAHREPWWFYLATLPVLLFPWFFMPRIWKEGLSKQWRQADRFCAVWFLSVFILMSIVSGKQIKYLMPILPAFSIWAAANLARTKSLRNAETLPLIAYAFLGMLLIAAPLLAKPKWPAWVSQVEVGWGIGFLVVLFLLRFVLKIPALLKIASASVVFVLALYLGVFVKAAPYYDVSELAQLIYQKQQQGEKVANLGKYHAQYQFAGRLENAVEALELDALDQWVAENPDGWVLWYPDDMPTDQFSGAEYYQDYRGGYVVMYAAPAIKAVLPVVE